MKRQNEIEVNMREDFLHYIWKFRLFSTPHLTTTAGLPLDVIHPGIHNFNAGPDFLDARVRIGNELWSGHVEIHIKGSDWNKHQHTGDAHYDNVILHAVFDNDIEIALRQAGDLPVLDMSQYIRENQWHQYLQWIRNKSRIPCDAQLESVEPIVWSNWKNRLFIERLETKANLFLSELEKSGGNWSALFYKKLAGNYGFHVNQIAMENLAESIPQNILTRHRSDPFQVEALLFGQAGLLNEIFADAYPTALQKEYIYLNRKYRLNGLNASQWNFGRIRPPNFPTIRIAQFAALLCTHEHLFSAILHQRDVKELYSLFDVEIAEYWSDHFRFDAATHPKRKMNANDHSGRKPGKDSIENILINTVSVVLFTYGKYYGDPTIQDMALKVLEFCSAENNAIVRKWEALGVFGQNAADSQSLIQLFNVYCTTRNCLNCQVGLNLLNRIKN